MSVMALIGKKTGMTSVFDDSGAMVGVTVVQVNPNQVLGLRTQERDGYEAVVIGAGQRRASRTRKPQQVAAEKAGLAGEPEVVREVEAAASGGPEIGSSVGIADVFEVGQYVDLIGTSIGKGFQGTVKRHNFSLGPASHGSKNYREPGSTGQATYPGRVFKGKKMPGQMGNKRRTNRNVRIVGVDAENNRLLVAGSVPGSDTSVVLVRHSIACKKSRVRGAK
jgi:large subunit ribosomal protein L3